MSPSVPYVGRLAPSPTGAQHIGNARTYLITWLAARSCQGTLPLRIEDIDSPRVKSWATQQIYDDLHWLNLDWDGEPIQQTSRLQEYRSALEFLKDQELVYPCTCTRKDVEQAASAPHQEHEGVLYPGTCAGRKAKEADSLESPFCWRFRLPETTYTFEDRFWGQVRLHSREIGGDFVVWKANDTPAYQLAVVVDDAALSITEVIRGDDLLRSTPRQMVLYQALGFSPPSFVHVPLVVGTDGRRLAKRHGDTRLSSLRQAGVTSEVLLGLLAWSCGWQSSMTPTTSQELLPLFSLQTIPRQPFVLEPHLLETMGYFP